MNPLNIYNIQSLLATTKKGIPLKYLFFWGHHPKRNGELGKECFSQWYTLPSQEALFQINGITYQTAEVSSQ